MSNTVSTIVILTGALPSQAVDTIDYCLRHDSISEVQDFHTTACCLSATPSAERRLPNPEPASNSNRDPVPAFGVSILIGKNGCASGVK